MGRELGGRFKREGTYVYLWLIHVEVRQVTKFCKAVILQLKKELPTFSTVHWLNVTVIINLLTSSMVYRLGNAINKPPFLQPCSFCHWEDICMNCARLKRPRTFNCPCSWRCLELFIFLLLFFFFFFFYRFISLQSAWTCFISFNFTMRLWDRYYVPHFTDDNTEARKHEVGSTKPGCNLSCPLLKLLCSCITTQA